MSINRLALLLAGALILLSAAGITSLTTERAGAARPMTTRLDGAPRSFPGHATLSLPRRQLGLSKVAASALVGGALGLGTRPRMVASSEAR